MSAVITQRDACLFLLFCSERDKLVFDIMDEDSNNKISYECVNVLPEDTEQIEDDLLTNNEILLLMREMEKQKQDMERQYKNMQEQFEKLKGVVDRKVGEEESSYGNNDKVLESENVERGDKIITLLSNLAKLAGVILFVGLLEVSIAGSMQVATLLTGYAYIFFHTWSESEGEK